MQNETKLIKNSTYYHIILEEKNTKKVWRIYGTYEDLDNAHQGIKKYLNKKDDALPKFPPSKWFVGNNNWDLV